MGIEHLLHILSERDMITAALPLLLGKEGGRPLSDYRRDLDVLQAMPSTVWYLIIVSLFLIVLTLLILVACVPQKSAQTTGN
jgi:hypothetical protein